MTRTVDKDGYPTTCFVCHQRILATASNSFHLARERNGGTEKLSAHLLCYLSGSCRHGEVTA